MMLSKILDKVLMMLSKILNKILWGQCSQCKSYHNKTLHSGETFYFGGEINNYHNLCSKCYVDYQDLTVNYKFKYIERMGIERFLAQRKIHEEINEEKKDEK